MKKLILFYTLSVFAFSPLLCQEAPLSSSEKISRWLDELEGIEAERALLVGSLQTANDEQKRDIERKEKALDEKEQELRLQIALSNSLGNIAGEQATYIASLERRLTFWKGSTVTLGICTLVLAIALLAANK
jgi:hypothetical protein